MLEKNKLGFAALLLCVGQAAIAYQGDDSRWNSQIAGANAELNALMAQGYAGSILVACGDDIIWEQDHGLPAAREGTPSYWVASITKQFTAAAILRLAEQDRLSLTDTIDRFFPHVPEDKAGITIEHLLTHRSGLPNAYAAEIEGDIEAASRAIFEGELLAPPGQGFQYTNDGYSLLAMIVELASGEPYEWYMAREIFRPAGMTQYGFSGDPIEPQSYIAPLPEDSPLPSNWGFRGTTGSRASLQDEFRWVRALANDSVISRTSVQNMVAPHHVLDNGTTVGFNWFGFSEGGKNWLNTRGYEQAGYNAIIQVDADSGLTIITNTHAGPPEVSGPPGSNQPAPWSRQSRTILAEHFAAENAPPCEAGPWPGGG